MYPQKIFEQTQGDSEGQGSLLPCSPWGRSQTRLSNCATTQNDCWMVKGWTKGTNTEHTASRAGVNGLVWGRTSNSTSLYVEKLTLTYWVKKS